MPDHHAAASRRGDVLGARESKRVVLCLVLLASMLAACGAEEAQRPTAVQMAAGLDDADPEIRAAALIDLRSAIDPTAEVRTRIVKAGMDSEELVRYEAILTIDAIQRPEDDECFSMLQHIAMSDGSDRNRQAARRAMDRVVGGPMAELRGAVDDPARRKLISEGGVLWDEGPAGLEQDLIEAAAEEVEFGSPEDWVDDALVLSQFGDPGVRAALPLLLEAVLSSPEDEQRIRATRVLGELGSRARPILRDLKDVVSDELQSDEFRHAAREAVLKIGTEPRESTKSASDGP